MRAALAVPIAERMMESSSARSARLCITVGVLELGVKRVQKSLFDLLVKAAAHPLVTLYERLRRFRQTAAAASCASTGPINQLDSEAVFHLANALPRCAMRYTKFARGRR